VFLAAVRLFQGHGPIDALLSGITLAVAALPEEFPVAMTFFLGVGVYRLARRQALVRRAVAVENIGRVTCICTDKTGTLTEGRLVLTHRAPSSGTTAARLVELAAMAAPDDSSDPLDAALFAELPARATEHKLASFPFTEDRRRETAVLTPEGGPQFLAVVKGAPETVFAMCSLTSSELDQRRREVASFAQTGHKVIAVATRELEPSVSLDVEPQSGFEFRGLLAFEDPVRPGVSEAVEACRAADIRVLMITGDHPLTATAIAGEIGLGGGDPVVMLADSMEQQLSGGSGQAAIRNVDVVARATPSQKLQLVKALQTSGETVAVTGDGVNDVPALQLADIGIAMGERGTQSAREVAAIVLLDDNFRTIVRAIREGRQLFLNLQLAFAYLLMVHIPLVVSAAAVPLANNPLLYLPIHIVWVELIIHPTTMLVFQEPPSSKVLAARRIQAAKRFFSGRAWTAILCSGAVIAAMITIGFQSAFVESGSAEHARSIAIATLISSSAVITVVLSLLATWTAKVIVALELVSLGLLIQVPVLADLVHAAPLHLPDWALVAGGAAASGLLAAVVRTTIRTT
jgi:Ca2+-transporting ATPase